MSGATIDFYLDFISPFGYLARHRLDEIAARHDCVIRYHPIDLNRIKLAAGNTGPPNRSIPPKLRYLTEDLRRWANRYGLPMVDRLPGADTGSLNKGLLLGIDRLVAADYVRHAWDCIWRFGLDPGLRSTQDRLAAALHWDPDEFQRFVHGQEAASRYEQECRAATERGIFGVPTFVVGEEMYWGNDRLEFLEEQLTRQG